MGTNQFDILPAEQFFSSHLYNPHFRNQTDYNFILELDRILQESQELKTLSAQVIVVCRHGDDQGTFNYGIERCY